jgi:hypothetical protein
MINSIQCELEVCIVDENTHDNVPSLSKRSVANRRNAQLFTGPRTEEGKGRSRRNALKHGILSRALLVLEGKGAEDPAEFNDLLEDLRSDHAPVGAAEEMLVEKIAVCWWRQKRALRCEAGLIRRGFTSELTDLEAALHPERTAITDHLSLPLGADLDRILRYETTIQRQLVYVLNQLERLQRARKGEHVPAPVSVHLSSDQ